MAITDKEKGVWGLDQVYNKINQGSIWEYSGVKQLWSWGHNQHGKLGQNNLTSYSSPVQIYGGGTWDGVLNLGSESTIATKSDGTAWTWGRNDSYGNLGLNDRTSRSSPTQIPGTTWPITDDFKISNFGALNAAIKTDGTLWTWGVNEYGILGVPSIGTAKRSSPVQVPGTTWKRIFTGGFAELAVKTDGTMWSWGSNAYGVLGLNQTGSNYTGFGNGQKYSSPTQVPGTTWDKIPQSGAYGRYAIKTDGTLWSWGYNAGGGLGLNDKTLRSSPTQIPGTTWNELYTGRGSNYGGAIKTDGTLWMFGRNGGGQLGQNNTIEYSSPIQIPGTWDKISIGGGTAMGIKTDGSTWVWGSNYNGALGQNSAHPVGAVSSPIQLPGDWLKITTNQNTTMAIRNS